MGTTDKQHPSAVVTWKCCQLNATLTFINYLQRCHCWQRSGINENAENGKVPSFGYGHRGSTALYFVEPIPPSNIILSRSRMVSFQKSVRSVHATFLPPSEMTPSRTVRLSDRIFWAVLVFVLVLFLIFLFFGSVRLSCNQLSAQVKCYLIAVSRHNLPKNQHNSKVEVVRWFPRSFKGHCIFSSTQFDAHTKQNRPIVVISLVDSLGSAPVSKSRKGMQKSILQPPSKSSTKPKIYATF